MNDFQRQMTGIPVSGKISDTEFDPIEGATLLSLFFGLGKTLRLVGFDNDTFKNQIGKFWERFKLAAKGTDKLTIKIVTGRLFINENLCRTALKSEVVLEAIERWNALAIGGIEINFQPETTGLATLFQILNQASGVETSEEIQNKLVRADVSGIRLLSTAEVEEGTGLPEEDRTHMRRQARSVFFQSMRAISESTSQILAGREGDIRQTKQVVHSLVDQLMVEDSSLLELTAIKDYDDYTFAHSVNVCIYSLAIGVNLQMDHRRLSQLGFSALFHDIGKTRLPSDVVKKPGAFDDDDWIMMRRHPSLGAKMLLKNFPISAHTVRGALTAFEHHINIDGTGYPRRRELRGLNLFSRIVTIADTYDALTSGRIYIEKQMPPIEVIRKMFYQMDQKFDQLLLKVFINSIGLFPAGSLLLLSNDQVAIVEKINPGQPGLPLVRVIGDRTGVRQTAKLVDLAAADAAEVQVKRFLNPQTCNIDLKYFVLNDLPVE